MGRKLVHLIFPQELIKEPVIYTVAKKFDVVPNIRRANVTETVGEVTLELSGDEENLKQAEQYLESIGVEVKPLPRDVIE
ncbi:MAG TPA: ferredoxin [Candidatus Latescibacteria bacterium]|nr:ferredoxin [Candidatus Latescibacterota bacterium]